MSTKPTAIVTGAAGGIGRALAERLLSLGYRVVIADVDATNGAAAQAALGADTLFIGTDVADWDSQAAMFKAAHAWAGSKGIEVFFANAGIEEREFFYNLPGDKDGEPVKPDMAVVHIDLHSVVYGLRLFRHYRRKAGAEGLGRLIAISSMSGFYAFPAAPVYSAAKSGVVGLIRSSSRKLRAGENITLNVISPGPVDTTLSPVMQKVVPAERWTPMALVLEVAEKILKEDITGQVFEVSNKKYYQRQAVDYADSNAEVLIEDMHRFLAKGVH